MDREKEREREEREYLCHLTEVFEILINILMLFVTSVLSVSLPYPSLSILTT